ncbi:hypothetical protein Alg130_11324 [Pyrenophora tritici-repentis]|nr:hypothetical protein Alg130_11324 [Pyrenophora tritici-repentis]
MCIENPSLRRAYCTKCKRVKETDRFRRLPRADPDGNEYERSCLSCLKKLNPTAVAPLGAPTATHEASHAPSIEHDPNSASPQRPVSQEECSSSYHDIEEISTAGSTENNTDGSSNAARWTLGDALRLDYTSRISQLTNEILEVVEAPSRTSEKFGSLLQYYKEYLRIYNHYNGCDGFYTPMATFGKDCFPEQHEFDLPGDTELKYPHDSTTATVLCASTVQLRLAMRSGISLPNIPCIYIPKEEQAVQRTVDDFIEELQGWTHAKLEYQRFSSYMRDEPRQVNGQKKRKASGHMSVKDFCARLDQRRNTVSAQRLSVAGLPPYNFLDISGSKLEFHRRPPVLDDLNFHLLGRAVARVRANHHRGLRALGKEHLTSRPTSELQHVDLESCLRFVLFGERGAASGYHMDVLNGTYISAVSGFKLWFVPSRPLSEQETREFGEEGSSWNPPVDLFKAVLMRPGDMLIMRPGYLIPHFVLTGEDSLMMGGMEWTTDRVPSVLNQLRFIIPRYNSTNEPVPRQLAQVLNALPSLAPEHADCVNAFIAWLKEKKLLCFALLYIVQNYLSLWGFLKASLLVY